jgi:hypothetical protein
MHATYGDTTESGPSPLIASFWAARLLVGYPSLEKTLTSCRVVGSAKSLGPSSYIGLPSEVMHDLRYEIDDRYRSQLIRS